MSIKIAIDIVNVELNKAFSSPMNVAIYGISELFPKKDKTGSSSVLPGISDSQGQIKYVGYDDKNPVILYHRLNSAQQIERPGSSYGDERTDQITTYNLSLYVYSDRGAICSNQPELLELIQTRFPDSLIISGYKTVVVRVQSVNFNTQSILRSEYQGTDARLRPERVLIQINYQIETTLRKKCALRCA